MLQTKVPAVLHMSRMFVLLSSMLIFLSHLSADLQAEVPDVEKLDMEEWAANGLTKDPVALSFDNKGRLYVAETARRSSVDIDMRSHRPWLLEDLATDSFETMRDFFQRKMSKDLSDQNKSWLQDRNGDGVHDYRDLREETERIRVIEDTDHDGTADKATLYADGFNEEFTGVAAGVMPYDGDVLMTAYPDLWRLRDTDGDNKADKREIMFRGFGVHAALDGHDLHGLTVGPEGKIYFSCGDNGFSIETKEGRRLHHPNTGGVLRMNPDGSDLEVFAYGLRNVQEFDFDKYGNMFGVDNDGDLEDERERAVYIAEGSDAGWRLNWQFRSEGWKKHNGGMTYNPWVAEGMWKPQHSEQPANITPPMQNYSVGPGGFKFNPGTALNDEYRDFFFCVQFPVKKITAFRTKSKGAGFEMVDDHTFNSGLMVSSLNFGPDGGCYLADWIGKWAPNNEGIIYRVDDPKVRVSNPRKAVQRLLNNGVSTLTNDQLLKLLGHADRRLRHLAQSELVHRERGPELIKHASDPKQEQLGRIHALWGLIQLNDATLNTKLARQLSWRDKDAQVRQQVARVAGDLKLPDSAKALSYLLNDPAPLVKSHAAIALGKVGGPNSVAPLFELLRKNADLDPFIRHAGVTGLAGVAKAQQLVERKTDESSSVRLAAVLALSRLKSPEIVEFLNDSDTKIVREVVRAIHDDFSIPDALPKLAEMLEATKLPLDEPILRRLISANFRQGDTVAANRLAKFVSNDSIYGDLDDTLKTEALECLAKWEQYPLVDRVEGRVRKQPRAEPTAGKQVLIANISILLQSASPNVSEALLRHINELKISIEPGQFSAWVTDPKVSPNARIEALRLLHDAEEPEVAELIDQIVDGEESTTANSLWQFAFGLLAADRPEVALSKMNWDGDKAQQRFFISQLPKIATPKADAMLEAWVAKQLPESRDESLTLDVLAAAKSRGTAVKLGSTLQTMIDGAKYGKFSFSQNGGDAERGEYLYKSHANAQCIRCHNAGGKGKQAGPMLDKIGQKPHEYLLEALVDPSATIAKGFESVTVLREDGKVIMGTIISEDEQVLTVGGLNKTYKVRKNEIEERIDTKDSAMPRMTSVLTPHEVRDIVAYLATQK